MAEHGQPRPDWLRAWLDQVREQAGTGHSCRRVRIVPVTRGDIQKELADVIVTAGIAMIGIAGGDADDARDHLEKRLTVVTERVGV